MRSGKLDKTIIIERAATTLDGYGVPSEDWSTFATLRAERVENAIKESIDADRGAVTETTIIFRTRFVDSISAADRVIFDGSAFNIVGLSEIGRRRGLEIKVQRLG
jgi:SPP1 family predicted phage head-tail adaptor